MRGRTLTLVLTPPLLLAGRYNPDHESLMKSMVEETERMVTVMQSIKDEASSRAAAPQIRDITTKLQDYKKRAETMQRPSAAEDKRLKQTYEPRILKAQADMQKEAMRIGRDGKLITPELESALREMSALKNK